MPRHSPDERLQPMRTRALSRRPVSVDVDERSFSAVLTSEASVRTWIPDPSDPEKWLEVDEILVTSGVDLSRAPGMPLVDSHNTLSIDNIVGVVDGIRAEELDDIGSALVIDARIVPSRADLLPAIQDGFFQQLSAGYVVNEYELEEREGQGQVPLARAVRWTLIEASLVPVGADANAAVRSSPVSSYPPPIIRKRGAAPKSTLKSTPKKRSKMSISKRAKHSKREEVSAEEVEALLDAAEEAVAAAEEAVDAVEEAVDALPDDTSDEIVERARRVRARLLSEEDAEEVLATIKDAVDDKVNEGDVADDEKKAVEEVRRLARGYGKDIVKLVDDLAALGSRSKDIRRAVRAAIVKRSATSDIAVAPRAQRSRDDGLSIRDIYARINKRG